jgi:hypothetical protein
MGRDISALFITIVIYTFLKNYGIGGLPDSPKLNPVWYFPLQLNDFIEKLRITFRKRHNVQG